MGDTVGGSQMLQLKARQSFVILRPVCTIRTQRITGAGDIDQIPAGIAVHPAVGIRVVKIPVENITGDFIIKTNAVIAENTGVRLCKGVMNQPGKLRLINAFLQGFLRRDAGYHHRRGLRQIVIRRGAVGDHRVGDNREFAVRADTGKLRRAVSGGILPEGFVIVKEKLC